MNQTGLLFLWGLWCGPRTKCSIVSFSASSKIWSRIRFIETMKQLVQRGLQCAGCYIVPDVSFQYSVFSLPQLLLLTPAFSPTYLHGCNSLPAPFRCSHTCKQTCTHIHLAVKERHYINVWWTGTSLCVHVFVRVIGIMYSYDCFCNLWYENVRWSCAYFKYNTLYV